MNRRNIITGILVIGILLVLAYYGGLFPLVITGGAGWFAEGAQWQFPENSLCYGTPVDVAVEFQRLALADEFTAQTYELWHTGGDGQGLVAILGNDPSASQYVRLLKGGSTFSLPSGSVFDNPVGSKALWNLTFTVEQSVTTGTGFCTGGNAQPDGGCAMSFDICVQGGVKSESGQQYCDGKSGTTRWAEFRTGRTFYWYPAAHFPNGCPKPPVVAGIQPPDTGSVPLPEKIDNVIDSISPSPTTRTSRPAWVYVVGLGGVVALLWYLRKRL